MTTSPAVLAWGRLRRKLRDREREDVPTIPTGVDTTNGTVRFAIGPNGEPRLLVPCTPSSRMSTAEASKLRVSLNRLTCESVSILFVDVMCLDPRLEPVFAELVSDIIRRLQSGVAPGVAVTGGIHDFRDLLRPAFSGPVSDEKIAGLIGELLVLQRLCKLDPGAIGAWTGPYGQRHDFRRANHALEVKTSMRADRRTVTINGIEQLSPPLDGTLILFHVRLERSDSGAYAVAALVEQLLSLGVDSAKLSEALSSAGCDTLSSQVWNRLRFSLEGVSAYEVAPTFPAITSNHFPDGLPSGLDNVRYDVNLDFARPYSLDDAKVNAVIIRFLS